MEVRGENISLATFAEKNGLEIIVPGREEIYLDTVNVNRPGLQLAGFFDYFGSNRVQVMGKAEMTYYDAKPDADKRMIMDMLLSSNQVPCLVISRDLLVDDIFKQACIKYNVPLLRSDLITIVLVNNLFIYLNDLLAPRITMHGGLIDVSGVGVLLTGKSGIGKSETALELVKRGHRLIADDAVILKKINHELYGSCPEIIRNFMEIRGIGILDIKSIYGISAVATEKKVDLVVEMEYWETGKEYDRLTGYEFSEEILGITLPKIVMPITPGRNIPIIIEAAATNYALKKAGYDAAKALIDRTLGK